MRRKHGPSAHGPAIGTPLAGLLGPDKVTRPKRRHIAAIVIGGLVLACLARKMPGYVPAIIATISILAAVVYWHRRDSRLVVMVATWPVVAVLAFALAATPLSAGSAKNVAKVADTSSVVAGGGVIDTLQGLGAWLYDRVKGTVKR